MPLLSEESHGKNSVMYIRRNFCWSHTGESKRNSLSGESVLKIGMHSCPSVRMIPGGCKKCLVFRKISCTFHLSFEDYFCSVKASKKWQTSTDTYKKEKTQGYGKKLRFYLFYWMILEYSNKGTVMCFIISLLQVETMLDNRMYWYECENRGKEKNLRNKISIICKQYSARSICSDRCFGR